MKTKGFTAPGGQEGKDVLIGERRLDDLALQWAKSSIAEGGFKSEEEVIHRQRSVDGGASGSRQALNLRNFKRLELPLARGERPRWLARPARRE